MGKLTSAKEVGGKYLGDCVCRIFMDFVGKELLENCKVVGPDVYIAGFTAVQFDFLIVDGSANPRKHTNAFEPKDVKVVFESKARGVFGGIADLQKGFGKIASNWHLIKNKHAHINFIYLTFQEAGTPKREHSINYWAETKKHLNGFRAFCLRDSRTHKAIEHEWEILITYLKTLL